MTTRVYLDHLVRKVILDLLVLMVCLEDLVKRAKEGSQLKGREVLLEPQDLLVPLVREN